MIKTSLLLLLFCVTVAGQSSAKRVKQPREVAEAYRVCNEFQRIFAEDLDFDRAFEATFTKDPARRRAIAIADSELGDIDLTKVDDATLLSIYKDQNQLFFLMLLLADAKDELENSILFPTQIDAIFERVKSNDNKNLPAYAEQLHRDVMAFRAHLNDLAAKYAVVADGIRKFRAELSKKLEPPDHVVKPLTFYSKGRVLDSKEEYYQVSDFAVIREGGQMKIIGIRFFTMRF